MGKGILELHLIDAKGLADTDIISKIDPYVVIQYRNQERKSSVAREWRQHGTSFLCPPQFNRRKPIYKPASLFLFGFNYQRK